MRYLHALKSWYRANVKNIESIITDSKAVRSVKMQSETVRKYQNALVPLNITVVGAGALIANPERGLKLRASRTVTYI